MFSIVVGEDVVFLGFLWFGGLLPVPSVCVCRCVCVCGWVWVGVGGWVWGGGVGGGGWGAGCTSWCLPICNFLSNRAKGSR